MRRISKLKIYNTNKLIRQLSFDISPAYKLYNNIVDLEFFDSSPKDFSISPYDFALSRCH